MTATTIGPFPLTRRGDSGHPVKTLQHLLVEHDADLDVDGIFGPKTEAAVKAFQEEEKLAVDGIAGPKTWAEVIVQVRKGDEGDAVKGVQEEFVFRPANRTRPSTSTASSAPRPTPPCGELPDRARVGGRRHRRPQDVAGAGQRRPGGLSGPALPHRRARRERRSRSRST